MIEPLRLTFEVACPAAHAFQVWTERIAAWWPLDHTVSGQRGLRVVLEPHLGGRIFERTPTGDLVNFCCMVSPYGAAEKQQLLEARSLEDRAETLIALVEYDIAKGNADGRSPLQ